MHRAFHHLARAAAAIAIGVVMPAAAQAQGQVNDAAKRRSA